VSMHPPTGDRTRYAVIGTGARAEWYIRAAAGAHADLAQIVALGDTNVGRVEHYAGILSAEYGVTDVRRFDPAELAAVIADGVDTVIITTPDLTHADYIVTALESGADVIVEKPLVIDAAGALAVAEAVERTGRSVTAAFNYRYAARNTALKQVVSSGRIGEVTSVRFEWVLDTVHGADYFRRWHRWKENSGGLLVHKASHHFDLVNWWIDDVPSRVYASGGLRFYGRENADRRGLGERPERGSTGPASVDPFVLDMRTNPGLTELYLEQEQHDGYKRDLDVFDEGITIEDNLAVVVDYAKGPTLSYALNAHSPWEGFTVAVNGTLGRAELEVVERSAVIPGPDGVIVDPSMARDSGGASGIRPVGDRLLVQSHWGEAEQIPIPESTGNHGGADEPLMRDLFRGPDAADPLRRAATWVDGLAAVSVGIAGNGSLAERRAVDVAEFAFSRFIEPRA
jgi:predicted dehydrogenase